MGTKVNSNYEDLITYTRASKGYALRPVSYGSNLVLNGTFGFNTNNWTAGGGASLLSFGKQLRVENPSSANFGYAVQGVATEVGEIYALSVDFNYIEANGLVKVGTTSGGDQILTKSFGSADEGTHRFKFVATSTTTHIRVGLSVNTANVEARFDNIVLQKITFDQPDGTLTLFEHPENVPRVEYDADGNRLGLLVEEQRTNLLRYSEDFENSYWDNISNATADNNTVTSPTGETNGATITATGSSHRAKIGIITTQNTTVTFSAFLKAGTQSIVGLHFADNLGDELNDNCDFDLSNGTVSSEGSSSTAKIQDMGNGWYRCSNTYTTNATGSTLAVRLATSSAGTYHVFGAQVEEASFPTSYIKNEGTSSGVTRSADVASIPVADFGYNQSAGTVFIEAAINGIDGTYSRYVQFNGSPNNLGIYHHPSLDRVVYDKGTVGSLAHSSTGTLGSFDKIIASSDSSGGAIDTNSGSLDTTTTTVDSGVTTVIYLGSSGGVNNFLNGHIKSIKYYPRRLSNAQLVELTSQEEIS